MWRHSIKKLLIISLFLIPNIVIGETCNIMVTKFEVEIAAIANIPIAIAFIYFLFIRKTRINKF